MPITQVQVCHPKADRLVVLPDDVETKTQTDSGIHLPDDAQAKEVKRKGKVIAVGDRVTRCVVGERILFGAYAGTPIEIDGVEHFLMADDDVLAGVD